MYLICISYSFICMLHMLHMLHIHMNIYIIYIILLKSASYANIEQQISSKFKLRDCLLQLVSYHLIASSEVLCEEVLL